MKIYNYFTQRKKLLSSDCINYKDNDESESGSTHLYRNDLERNNWDRNNVERNNVDSNDLDRNELGRNNLARNGADRNYFYINDLEENDPNNSNHFEAKSLNKNNLYNNTSLAKDNDLNNKNVDFQNLISFAYEDIFPEDTSFLFSQRSLFEDDANRNENLTTTTSNLKETSYLNATSNLNLTSNLKATPNISLPSKLNTAYKHTCDIGSSYLNSTSKQYLPNSDHDLDARSDSGTIASEMHLSGPELDIRNGLNQIKKDKSLIYSGPQEKILPKAQSDAFILNCINNILKKSFEHFGANILLKIRHRAHVWSNTEFINGRYDR